MINRDECNTGNKRFIKSMPENFIFGIPIILMSGTFYPINHQQLFLRYYVSYSGYIYDALSGDNQKYSLNDIICFRSTMNDAFIQFTLKEIIWRTFYRFPNGKNYALDGTLNYKPKFIQTKYNDYDDGYLIDGVMFKQPIFSVQSKLYNELIVKDRLKLGVSEDGAIYNVKAKRFMMVHQDDEGYPYIYSKSNTRIRINELIASAWYPDIYNSNNFKLYALAYSEMFVTKNNLLLYLVDQNRKIELGDTGHYLQNLAVASYNPHYDHINASNYYSIPINKFYGNLKFSVYGTLKHNVRGILKPYSIVYEKSTSKIKDVYYKIPNTNSIFSIIDILMWSLYRLTRDVIFVIDTKFVMTERGIPILEDLFVVTRTPRIEMNEDVGLYIGDEFFPKLICGNGNNYYNYFISKNGALFYNKSHIFIPYNLKLFESNMMTTIPLDRYTKRISLGLSMLYSWTDINITKNTKVIPINGISTDISIHNIRLKNNSDDLKIVDIVNKIYGIRDLEGLALQCQIPEVII